MTEKDPFEIRHHLVPQDYTDTPGLDRVSLRIRVGRPPNFEFFQVSPTLHADLLVLPWQEGLSKVDYLVLPQVRVEVISYLVPKTLFTLINRDKVISAWLLRLPGQDGRLDHWTRSAREAVALAESDWMAIASNGSAGYKAVRAKAQWPAPSWPEELAIPEIVQQAFRDHIIDSREHHVIQKIHGLV